MSGFDVNGLYTRFHNWVADRNAAIKIQAVRMDEEDDGIAAALNLAFLRDGRALATGDFKMGGYKITGLSLGTAGAPSVSFTGDAASGFFQSAVNTASIAAGGVEVAQFKAGSMRTFLSLGTKPILDNSPSAAVAIASGGANAAVLDATSSLLSGILLVREITTTNSSAMYLITSQGAAVLLGGDASWSASTTVPAGAHASVAYNAGAVRIYNNLGGAGPFNFKTLFIAV
jgi:hypothetical protein